MEDGVWGVVTKFYKEKFHIDSDLVVLLSDFDILILCVSGASIESISNFLEIDEESVSSVIEKYFQFKGWTDTLCINPISIYRSLNSYSFEEFKSKANKDCISQYSNSELEKMFSICSTFLMLEDTINEKWI